MDKTEIKARLSFRKSALEKLREAYLALLTGGVKSYTINDRQITKLDLPDLKEAIDELEEEVDELESLLAAGKPRRMFAVIPRDW